MHPMIVEELRRKRAAGGGAPKTYATWNPADKGANIVLSNGDFTADRPWPYTWTGAAVRSTIVKNSGIHTAELYCATVAPASSVLFGIATPTTSLTNIYAGQIFGYYGSNGYKYVWGVGSAYATSFTAGDYIGLEVDFDAGCIRFYKNGAVLPLIVDARISGNDFHLFFGSYYMATVILNTGATPFQHPILPIDGWFA